MSSTSNEIAVIKLDKNEIICKKDIAFLKSLVLNPQTQQKGLNIIRQAGSMAVMKKIESVRNSVSKYDDINESLVIQNSDIINPDTGAIKWSGVLSRFYQYLDKYYIKEADGMPKPNIIKIIADFFNVPKRIKSIDISVKIIEKCKYIEDKYIKGKYLDQNSQMCLPNLMKKQIEYLADISKDEKFYDRMKAMGAKEFLTSVTVSDELGKAIQSWRDDLIKLEDLYEKRINLLINNKEIKYDK